MPKDIPNGGWNVYTHSPAHKESMQSTQTCDNKWHSTEFLAPNAKGCDPATRDCRGGRGMTWTVKRVQSVLCHSSCYMSLLPCLALHHARCGMLCAAGPSRAMALLHGASLMVPARSLLSTATLKWGVFGVDWQQKGHICDDVSAGIKEDREGTARGKQMEKPPGDPRVEQGLVTTTCPSAVMWCSSKVAKRCVHRDSSALLST